MTTCTCGRSFTHCRSCGFKAVYRSKFKSINRSMQLGKKMDVFTCPRCGSDTDETDTCTAGTFKRISTIVREEPKRPEPGSEEYITAANERLRQLTEEEELTFEKAVYRMKSEGWVFEESVPKAESVVAPQEIEEKPSEITLDTVLEAMKEEATPKDIDLNRILENMRKK